MYDGDVSESDLRIALGMVALAAVSAFVVWFAAKDDQRPTPRDYTGKFRRPDGRIVHVARMRDGKLMVASDTQPPVDLGNVDGRELLRWEKLATSPDGDRGGKSLGRVQDRIAGTD